MRFWTKDEQIPSIDHSDRAHSSIDPSSIEHGSIDHRSTNDSQRGRISKRTIYTSKILPPYSLRSLNSTDDDSLRAMLQAQLPAFNDYAVDTLWRDCRQQVPDVDAKEIASLFAIKLPGSRGRGIENQDGFFNSSRCAELHSGRH